MNHKKLLPQMTGLTLVLLFLVACGTPQPTSTPTPVPPTATPTVTPLPFVEGTEFPTGRFVHANANRVFEFDEDGTWRYYEGNMESPTVSGKYGITGSLYTEMTHDHSGAKMIPMTYYWAYDGEKLTFQLWGEDVETHRRSCYDGQTYIKSDTSEPAATPLPSVEGTEFPTGRLVHEQFDRHIFEFDEDGTWRYFEGNLEVPAVQGKYCVNGDLYTEMTHDCPPGYPKIPATYTWTYDGQKLTFHLWGEDVMSHRKGCYDGQTYIKVE